MLTRDMAKMWRMARRNPTLITTEWLRELQAYSERESLLESYGPELTPPVEAHSGVMNVSDSGGLNQGRSLQVETRDSGYELTFSYTRPAGPVKPAKPERPKDSWDKDYPEDDSADG